MRMNPYLSFDGQCEDAFTFYERCLNGTITMMVRYAGSPMEGQVPPAWRDKIIHARMTVGSSDLMASDSMPNFHQAAQGFSVSLNIDEPAEAERVFQALSAGGTVRMPIQQTFWAIRFGMLTDRFGIPWMINCEQAD